MHILFSVVFGVGGMLALFFTFTYAQSSACHLLNSSNPVPQGYGAAYNSFSTGRELIAETFCDNNTVSVVVGQNEDQSTVAVWKQGWKWNGSSWSEITLSGTPFTEDSNWILGTGRVFIPSSSFSEGVHAVAVFACVLEGGNWQCGCRDNSCGTSNWMLQQFAVSSTLPPSPSGCIGAPQGVCDAYDNGTATGTYCKDGNTRTVTGDPDYVFWAANNTIYHRLSAHVFIEVSTGEWDAGQAVCESVESALDVGGGGQSCIGAPQGVCDAYLNETATGTYCKNGIMSTVTGTPEYVYWGANNTIYHRMAHNVFADVPQADWDVYETACQAGTTPNGCTGAPQGVCTAYINESATGTYCNDGVESTVTGDPDYVYWGGNDTIYHRLYDRVFNTISKSEWDGTKAICAAEESIANSIVQCKGAPQGVCDAYTNGIATGTYCKDGNTRTVTGDPDYVFWAGNNTIYYRLGTGSFVPISEADWNAGQAACGNESVPRCIGAPQGVCDAYTNGTATGTYCTDASTRTVTGDPDYVFWGGNDTIYYRLAEGVFIPVPRSEWDAGQSACEAMESQLSLGTACVGAPQELCTAYNNGTATGNYCAHGIMSTVAGDPDYAYWGPTDTIYYRLAHNVFVPVARNEWDAYEQACLLGINNENRCEGASSFVCDTYKEGIATGTYCRYGAESTVTGDPDYVYDGFSDTIHYRLWDGVFETVLSPSWAAGQAVCALEESVRNTYTTCTGAPQGVCNAYNNGTATGTYCKDGNTRTVTGDPDYVFWGGNDTIYYRLDKGSFAEIPRATWDAFQTQCDSM